MSITIPALIWATMQAEADAFESFAEQDWTHDPGPRSNNRWKNVKSGKIVYSATNPGGTRGSASQPPEGIGTAFHKAIAGQGAKPEEVAKPEEGIGSAFHQALEKPRPQAAPRAIVQRKTPEEREQLFQDARAKVKDVLAGERTPEAAHELIGALSELTVKQLHDIKKEYGLKASGPRKEELKKKIAARMAGATTPADKIKRTPAPKPEPWKGTSEPEIGQVYNAPTSDLQVDPERFQFKLNTNKEGVTQELKSVTKWNPDFAGVLAVWKDPKDGKSYVVNGHHRRELAGRLGVDNLAVRYIDAKTPEEARAMGALINMAEGRGTPIDAAKFMRDAKAGPEQLQKAGVSLKGKLIDDAMPLTKLNDRIFDRVARGSFDPEKAKAIGKHLDSPDLQNKLVSLLDKREEDGKDLSPKVVEEMAREMASTPTHTVHETGGLFGDIESEESLFVERNELKSHIRQALSKDVRDFQAVASQRRAGRVAEAGNVLNVEKNKQIAQESDQQKNVFDSLVNRKGAVSDAVNEAAKKFADAKGKKAKDAAKAAAVESVRAAIKAESESSAVGGPAGGVLGKGPPGDHPQPTAASAAPADGGGANAGGNDLTGMSKEQAKEVMKSIPAPDKLPEGHHQYFNVDKADKTVPMDKIVNLRGRPEGIANAGKFMEGARLGKLPKRDPVKVVENPDGTFTVADGNSTFANAKQSGWKDLPVKLVGRDFLEHEQDKTLAQEHASAKESVANHKHFTPEEMAIPRTGVISAQSSKEEVFKAAQEKKPEFDNILDHGHGVQKALGADAVSPKNQEDFDAAMRKPGAVVMMAPIKSDKRSTEKVNADYGGNWNELHDTVRGTVAVDTMSDVPKAISAIRAEMEKKGWTLAKAPKNRFGTPTMEGYSDIMLNARAPNGLVTELQVHVKPMVAAKDKAHGLYEQERTIFAKMKLENRGATDEEKGQIKELIQKQRDVYGTAYLESLGLHGSGGPVDARQLGKLKEMWQNEHGERWDKELSALLAPPRGKNDAIKQDPALRVQESSGPDRGGAAAGGSESGRGVGGSVGRVGLPAARVPGDGGGVREGVGGSEVTHAHVKQAKSDIAAGRLAVKGNAASPEIKSDLSGDTIRRHVTLPNGARVHPDELHRVREGEGGKAELGPEQIAVRDPMNKGEDTHPSFAKAVHAVGAYPIRHNDRVTIQGPHGYSATKTRKEWRDVAAKLKDMPESMAQWMDRENPETTSEAARNAPASGGMASEKESKSFFTGGQPGQGKLFDYKTKAFAEHDVSKEPRDEKGQWTDKLAQEKQEKSSTPVDDKKDSGKIPSVTNDRPKETKMDATAEKTDLLDGIEEKDGYLMVPAASGADYRKLLPHAKSLSAIYNGSVWKVPSAKKEHLRQILSGGLKDPAHEAAEKLGYKPTGAPPKNGARNLGMMSKIDAERAALQNTGTTKVGHVFDKDGVKHVIISTGKLSYTPRENVGEQGYGDKAGWRVDYVAVPIN